MPPHLSRARRRRHHYVKGPATPPPAVCTADTALSPLLLPASDAWRCVETWMTRRSRVEINSIWYRSLDHLHEVEACYVATAKQFQVR